MTAFNLILDNKIKIIMTLFSLCQLIKSFCFCNFCDGQVRVTADLLGLNDNQPPFCQPIIQGKKLLKDKLNEWVASERHD